MNFKVCLSVTDNILPWLVLICIHKLCCCSWNSTYERLIGPKQRQPFPQRVPLSVSPLVALVALWSVYIGPTSLFCIAFIQFILLKMLILFMLAGNDRISSGSMGAGGTVRLSDHQNLHFNVRKMVRLCKSHRLRV